MFIEINSYDISEDKSRYIIWSISKITILTILFLLLYTIIIYYYIIIWSPFPYPF